MNEIQLTTPFAAGDFSASDYTHARVERVVLDIPRQILRAEIALGYYDGEDWVSAEAIHGKTKIHVTVPKAELGPLLADAKILVDALTQKLIDDGLVDGTAV